MADLSDISEAARAQLLKRAGTDIKSYSHGDRRVERDSAADILALHLALEAHRGSAGGVPCNQAELT